MLIAMVAADLNKWLSFGPCQVRSIWGFNNQATDLYIQLHEASRVSASVVIANGAVPKGKSLLAQQSNGFKYEFQQPIDFSELVLAISTTEVNLTAVGAAGGLDMTVNIDGPFLVSNYSTLTVAGTSAATTVAQQIWAESAGPKTLMRLDVATTSGVAKYAVGYAVDTPDSTHKQLFILPLPADGSLVKYSCGDGFSPLEKIASDQSLKQGLTIWQATTTAPGNQDAVSELICRGMYI